MKEKMFPWISLASLMTSFGFVLLAMWLDPTSPGLLAKLAITIFCGGVVVVYRRVT